MNDVIANVGSQFTQKQQAVPLEQSQVDSAVRQETVQSTVPDPVRQASENQVVRDRADAPAREELQRFAENLNRSQAISSRGLQFEVNDDAGLTIINVMDKSSEEIVRQIPSEEVVNLAKFFTQQIQDDPESALKSIGLDAFA